ncbi:hypothetical protein H0E84_05635 [Luteimonas sp. SJ-92]|uniref:Secreted protein n=1 Tax=Luteimonas salinisoli TaxID=2752307 RepID=A0A853JB49_9GAMM|nr:hypothetical protein [Luteimonas salinisoli]NZA25858.1 hypothetical protein [Luteimonas salinisoli]
MRRIAAVLVATLLGAPAVLPAAGQAPEIERETAPPQAVGAAHTLRQIPEACARIEGVFTGQADPPYRFSVKQTSPGCRPRARLVDADRVRPDPADGWVLNDVVRIPAAACPSQVAVARIWRRPAEGTLQTDAQGRVRIYLDEARAQAESGNAPQPGLYAAQLRVEGEACD